MIEQYLLDQLKATPIEGVAERLGLRVERHKALCPFHDDSRPSLTTKTVIVVTYAGIVVECLISYNKQWESAFWKRFVGWMVIGGWSYANRS